MREALFILAILAVLLLLTVVRYRKQISGGIGFAKALKEAHRRPEVAGERSAGALVECSRCGIRIPESKAVSLGRGVYRCDRECVKAAAR